MEYADAEPPLRCLDQCGPCICQSEITTLNTWLISQLSLHTHIPSYTGSCGRIGGPQNESWDKASGNSPGRGSPDVRRDDHQCSLQYVCPRTWLNLSP